MLTITTADPSNTQSKIAFLTKDARKNSNLWHARRIIDLPDGIPPQKLDEVYQSLIDDDIDLYNPHLNVRDAYICHAEQQNASLKTHIAYLEDDLAQADRVILALLASLIVVAVIAVTLAV